MRHLSAINSPRDFIWPDTLVLDVVVEQYRQLVSPEDNLRIAKLHARLLRHLFENDLVLANALRKRLVEDCAALGLDLDDIGAVDRCAFWEISALVHHQIRPSSRVAAPIGEGLHAAICRVGSMSVGAGQLRASA